MSYYTYSSPLRAAPVVDEFLNGIELSRRYWSEAVKPILIADMPESAPAAALIGPGSEVLGLDTERSRDHAWGPRVQVFFSDGTLDKRARASLNDRLDRDLPDSFGGFPTRFPAVDGAPAQHQVEITTISRWFRYYLDVDIAKPLRVEDWLTLPTQLLRSATAGAVFEDPSGSLGEARERLAWYPDDIWLYILACQWRRLDQEEPFVGRAAEVGDELGSTIIASRLVRDLMRLGFLTERDYAPYSKWLVSAFAHLACGPHLASSLEGALKAPDFQTRQRHLVTAFESIARAFNDLNLVEPQDSNVRPFWSRPFLVLGSGRFAEVCMRRTSLKPLGWTGAIDQFVDSTDALSGNSRLRSELRASMREILDGASAP